MPSESLETEEELLGYVDLRVFQEEPETKFTSTKVLLASDA